MSIKKTINENFLKLQSISGASRNEIIAVIIIIFGLLLGSVVKYIYYNDTKNDRISQKITYLLDSLAEVSRSTYIGTDPSGVPDSELVKGDTIVKDGSVYSVSLKKELPKEKININTASKNELMKLPGVGEATANIIIEFRYKKKFEAPEDLMYVKGIGQKKFAKLKDFIVVK